MPRIAPKGLKVNSTNLITFQVLLLNGLPYIAHPQICSCAREIETAKEVNFRNFQSRNLSKIVVEIKMAAHTW
jgi:hypothetical protein